MKEITFEGCSYEINRGRDVARGGVYLELRVAGDRRVGAVAEIFLYEKSGDVVFNSFQKEIAVELAEILISEAKKSLGVADK